MKAGEQLSVVIETDAQQAEHKKFLQTMANGERAVAEAAEKRHTLNTGTQQPAQDAEKQKIKDAIKAKLLADNDHSNSKRI